MCLAAAHEAWKDSELSSRIAPAIARVALTTTTPTVLGMMLGQMRAGGSMARAAATNSPFPQDSTQHA